MVKIIDKIKQQKATAPPYFSFEYFPPKTEDGVANLYERIDRMTSLQPMFIDITWGAGGSTRDLTLAISQYAQRYFGVEVLLHLSCTNMRIEDLKVVLAECHKVGIKNILALRGDPPQGAASWQPIEGGLKNAIDLVKLIRNDYGNYFCIAVAGFPEGHPSTIAATPQSLKSSRDGRNVSIMSPVSNTPTSSTTPVSNAVAVSPTELVHNESNRAAHSTCNPNSTGSTICSEDRDRPTASIAPQHSSYNAQLPQTQHLKPLQLQESLSEQQIEFDKEFTFLKQKVDAGADFVLTNFFYDPTVFLQYLNKCRAHGISCPIIPGMMPIQNYSSFTRMTTFCRTRVPDSVKAALESIKDDDEAVKTYGVNLCVNMCHQLLHHGVRGFHFYTLNLEKSVMRVLRELGIEESSSTRRALPWRGSRSNLQGMAEDVRPINWANRTKSYINRTNAWDEFPNGRWGDKRSPAFGELSQTHFYRPVEGTKEDLLAMWGEAPITPQDVHEVFARYVEGSIPIIPWCEATLQKETAVISNPLAEMNRAGYLTINSQPAVNGERSDHAIFGWGGPGGRVYQKAYVEFFVSPNNLKFITSYFTKYPNLSVYQVNRNGEGLSLNTTTSTPTTRQNMNVSADDSIPKTKNVTAVTWGVFPDKEVLQPTIFDPETFLVWSKEAFELWTQAWASIYDDESESCGLIYEIYETYFLVAVIDNDYVDSNVFKVFETILREKSNSCNW